MGRAIAFIAAELLLLITPMMFPTIPFEVGTFIWGVALTLFLFAFYWWWSPKRSLSFGKKSKLSNNLRLIQIPQGRLHVMTLSQTEECVDFAADICSAVKAAGIESSIDTYLSGGDPTFKGVRISAHGPEKDLSWAYEVQAALKSVGIDANVNFTKERPEYAQAYIDVGRKD